MATDRRPASPEWVVNDRADKAQVDGMSGGWGVIPAPSMRGASFTDFSRHEMAVPLGESDTAKAVRLHELLHARLSPASVPSELMTQLGVSPHAVRVAEEWRMNYVARVLGNRNPSSGMGVIEHLTDGTEQASADFAVSSNSWESAVHLLVSTVNTGAYKVVKRRLRRNPKWKEAVAEIDTYMKLHAMNANARAHFPTETTSTAPTRFEWVRRGLSGAREQTVIPEGFLDSTLPVAMKIDEWVAIPPTPQASTGMFVRGRPERIDLDDKWEELRFGMTSLTETTSSFISRRRRPSLTGKVPRRPDRLLTDPERRVFTETVRGVGGVVVFDCSGSMGVRHSDIRDAVRQFAGATVVAYSNNRHGSANAWVLARNGRMISESDFEDIPLNNGNGVDLPILRWAVRQRRSPRDFIMWVSDGCVTGRGDHSSEGLLRATARFCQTHNIIGVEDSREAIELLADMKRRGSFPRHKHCATIQSEIESMRLAPERKREKE